MGTFSGALAVVDPREKGEVLNFIPGRISPHHDSTQQQGIPQRGGCTQVSCTPDGIGLVSASRKDNNILVWDIRNFVEPVFSMSRSAMTNQRIGFDITPCGSWLVSGSLVFFIF